MQMAYRATRRHQPQKSDTLVSSREQAFALIANLDKKLDTRLNTKLPSQERATYLCARAVLYEALGDKQMLEAAKQAYAFSKTAQSAALVAVALHHFGRIEESIEWYTRSYKYPHEAGFEIDIGYSGALLFQQTAETWLKAWKIVKTLKKRIVYSAYLPFWDGRPVKELQVLSEGGFGDLIQNCRYLPLLKDRGVQKVTVFLPPYFFDHGFVDLAKRNDWWPETKLLTECRAGIPSAGFFDLPAIFESTPKTLPPAPLWATNTASKIPRENDKPRVGFCWAARAMETPIVAENVYRALSREKAQELVHNTDMHWVSLQKDECLVNMTETGLRSWEHTAAVIANLDLVVTVDTAIFHLAASLGKPTWLVLSGAVDWKFGITGKTMPWYKNVRIFRNNDFGFDNSVAEITQALNSEILSLSF